MSFLFSGNKQFKNTSINIKVLAGNNILNYYNFVFIYNLIYDSGSIRFFNKVGESFCILRCYKERYIVDDVYSNQIKVG